MIELKGNGKMVSKTIPVSSFLRLHISITGMTELIQSNDEKVVVESDENLLEYFDAVNSGRTLYVSSEAKFRNPSAALCRVKIYFREFDKLSLRNDGGHVISREDIILQRPLELSIQSIGNTNLTIHAPGIKLVNQSQGEVRLSGKCNLLEIKNQSEGSLFATGMIAEELNIRNLAEGDVELFAEKTISIVHMGWGYVHYYGNAILKDVKQYGEGIVKRMDEY